MTRGSERDRERFSRARRDLIDALQLWRMLSETPEGERDETLQDLVAIAERSLAEASEEYQSAASALGYHRAPPSPTHLRATDRRTEARPRVSTMRTEDLMMFEPPPERPDPGSDEEPL